MFFMEAKRIAIVIVGAILNAIALNFFFISANVYASGFTGMSQILNTIFVDYVGINITTGVLLLLLNIPVFILGWLKVGKGFTVYSLISVLFTSLALEVLPIIQLSNDI